MRQQPAVAVPRRRARRDRELAAERQFGQRRLGLLGQRPGLEALAAERQLRRLDADQPDLAAVAQEQGVAVDDLDRPADLVGSLRQGGAGRDVGGEDVGGEDGGREEGASVQHGDRKHRPGDVA